MVYNPVSLVLPGTNPRYVLVHPQKKKKMKQKNTKKGKGKERHRKEGNEKKSKRSKNALKAQAESLGGKVAVCWYDQSCDDQSCDVSS